MPTRKIKDLNNQYCRSPDHGVPTHQYFENGLYEHTCSACGKKTIFEVNRPTFETKTTASTDERPYCCAGYGCNNYYCSYRHTLD